MHCEFPLYVLLIAACVLPCTSVHAAPFVDRICHPQDAPDVGAKVRLGPPRVVMLAPEGDTSWGSFNFPSVWRLRDGRLVCAVCIGQDEMSSDADYHYLWYISDGRAEHWTHAVVNEDEAESFVRERITLSDGRQLYYKPKMVSVDKLSCKPIPSFEGIGYKGMNVYYRLGEMDDECRYLTMYSRGPRESEWRTGKATMDPDIIVPAYKETAIEKDSALGPTHSAIATHLRKLVEYVGDDRLPALGLYKSENSPVHLRSSDRPGFSIHNASWGASLEDLNTPRPRDMAIRVQIPSPLGCRLHDYPILPILELADGTLMTTSYFFPAPASGFRIIRKNGELDTGSRSNLFKSTDGGATWSYYASMPFERLGKYQVVLAHITPNMPKGNWVALLRTTKTKGTDNSPLIVTRSYDQGRTWTTPEAIRPSSVNPVGGLLPNGIAFRMYGRPGQYMTFCADGEGKEWGNDVILTTGGSCANSCTYVTGPDSFVVVYSDYEYRDTQGRQRKAVIARRIVVER